MKWQKGNERLQSKVNGDCWSNVDGDLGPMVSVASIGCGWMIEMNKEWLDDREERKANHGLS